METRAMETALMYVKDMMESSFEKIKTYLEHDIATERGEWMRTVYSYGGELNMTWQKFREVDRKALKRRLRDWDTQKWMEEMLQKPTLKWYREVKLCIGYDRCYNNSKNSEYLEKPRTSSLQLEEHLDRGKEGYDKT